MPPPWIADLDDFVHWLQQVVETSGAIVPDEVIRLDDAPLIDLGGGQEERAVVVQQFHITFYPSGNTLHIQMYVFQRFAMDSGDSLGLVEVDEYSFHLQTANGECIWREDKDPRHAGDGVGTVHRHEGPDEVRGPSDGVELDEAIELAWAAEGAGDG